MTDQKSTVYGNFLKSIIFWGRITLLVAMVLSFTPALYLAFFHGIMPEAKTILTAFSMIASILVTSWIVEPIAYFPIVGTSGTYMSWLAGNISNMRVPVSAISQQSAGVQEGTPEGDIISTLGIGMSVLVNLVILFLAAIFGTQVIAALPESVQAAFNYILPAVFGAVLANFAIRDLKLGLFALVVAFVLTYFEMPTWVTLPVCVFGTIALAILLFKKKEQKTKE